ncbi:MAG: hypothetical protein IOD03_10460 [Methylocystis sp.]|nr:hypothetical protein [Methylocystis sp.]MCA3591223.1 hypothetical protein [Methylocystis sp.]
MTRFAPFTPMLTSPAIQSVRRRSIGRGFGARLAVVVAAGGLLPACTAGSDPGNPLRGPASAIGWATTTGEPKDFVKERRSSTELAYIPVGRPVPQRSIALRNPAGVKSLEEELDRQRERSDAFARRGLPRGAYGRDLPSVAAPPGSGPESYPVSPDRLRQIRENSRQSTD